MKNATKMFFSSALTIATLASLATPQALAAQELETIIVRGQRCSGLCAQNVLDQFRQMAEHALNFWFSEDQATIAPDGGGEEVIIPIVPGLADGDGCTMSQAERTNQANMHIRNVGFYNPPDLGSGFQMAFRLENSNGVSVSTQEFRVTSLSPLTAAPAGDIKGCN